MTSSAGGSQNINNARTKIPSGGTGNKKPDQTSQSDGRFSGARVSRIDNLKSRVTKFGKELQAKPRKILANSFKNIKTIGTERKARAQIKKANLSEDSKEKQEELNEMLKDHEVMKNCEKMPENAGIQKNIAELQKKYNIESSLDLLLEIKKQYKSIPKTTKQAKDMIQEFYQLGEILEKEAKEISSKISMELAKTSDTYRKKFEIYDDTIKKSQKNIERVKSNPEHLRLAKDTLQKSTNGLEAVKKEYKNAIDMLEFKGKEEIQKKVDLYSERINKIIKTLENLPEKQQNKFKVKDLMEKKGVPVLVIQEHITAIENARVKL